MAGDSIRAANRWKLNCSPCSKSSFSTLWLIIRHKSLAESITRSRLIVSVLVVFESETMKGNVRLPLSSSDGRISSSDWLLHSFVDKGGDFFDGHFAWDWASTAGHLLIGHLPGLSDFHRDRSRIPVLVCEHLRYARHDLCLKLFCFLLKVENFRAQMIMRGCERNLYQPGVGDQKCQWPRGTVWEHLLF